MTNTVLFFDVETTGLLPRNGTLEEYPYIIQLAYILFDLQSFTILEKYNVNINISEDIEITPFITNLTGINREMCNKGVTIQEAIYRFYDAYTRANCIVAHNMFFDRKMILCEINRHFHKDDGIKTMFYDNKREFCTMLRSMKYCNLKQPGRNTPKFPKLCELYQKIHSNDLPDHLHNALIDTLTCLRCYIFLESNGETTMSDIKFRCMLRQIEKIC